MPRTLEPSLKKNTRYFCFCFVIFCFGFNWKSFLGWKFKKKENAHLAILCAKVLAAQSFFLTLHWTCWNESTKLECTFLCLTSSIWIFDVNPPWHAFPELRGRKRRPLVQFISLNYWCDTDETLIWRSLSPEGDALGCGESSHAARNLPSWLDVGWGRKVKALPCSFADAPAC